MGRRKAVLCWILNFETLINLEELGYSPKKSGYVPFKLELKCKTTNTNSAVMYVTKLLFEAAARGGLLHEINRTSRCQYSMINRTTNTYH